MGPISGSVIKKTLWLLTPTRPLCAHCMCYNIPFSLFDMNNVDSVSLRILLVLHPGFIYWNGPDLSSKFFTSPSISHLQPVQNHPKDIRVGARGEDPPIEVRFTNLKTRLTG